MKHSIAVYCESTILELDQLYINGGKRGFLVSITPEVLKMLITPITVQVAIGPA
jgi:prolyl-tRNA editing enzyme YbaK/EbsC (Cys-tRNA(Pro) deacylase)